MHVYLKVEIADLPPDQSAFELLVDQHDNRPIYRVCLIQCACLSCLLVFSLVCVFNSVYFSLTLCVCVCLAVHARAFLSCSSLRFYVFVTVCISVCVFGCASCICSAPSGAMS